MRDITLGETIYIKFTTRAFATGTPTTLAGTPVVSAYVGAGLTQITAGVTLGVDHDGVVGLNLLTIVATAGNGFATGTDVDLVVTTGTVGGVSVVGEVVGGFTIERSAAETLLSTRLLGTIAAGTHTAQSGDSFARIGAPAGASVSADVAAVKSDTAATLLDTGTDGVVVAAASKTGYTLSAAGVQAVWDALTSALTTAGSVGKKLADWVLGTDNKAVLSNNAHTGAVIPTVTTTTGVTNAVGITAAAVDAIWDEPTAGHATAGTTGKALTDASSAGDPWSTALPGAYGVGTAGKIIGDRIDATVSSRATQTSVDTLAGYVDTEVAAIKAKTDNLPAAPAATGDIPTTAVIADAVWDEAIAGHLAAGSTGGALNAAGAAGDPWTTTLPGAYGVGSAGKIIGDNINATISSRLATAWYTAPDNASITTILADTNDIQTRLPAALVAGRIDSSVGAMAANVLTASALATDAVTEIQSGLATAASIAALNNLSAAQVNAEVLDVLVTDTFAELAAIPAATASLKDKITFICMLARNKLEQTATTATLRRDDAVTAVGTATVSDDGTTATRGEWV